MNEIIIKSYKNEKAFQRDAKKMAEKGYETKEVMRYWRNAGRLNFLSFGWLFGSVKPKLVVRYRLGG